jgi:hypothetical protein
MVQEPMRPISGTNAGGCTSEHSTELNNNQLMLIGYIISILWI